MSWISGPSSARFAPPPPLRPMRIGSLGSTSMARYRTLGLTLASGRGQRKRRPWKPRFGPRRCCFLALVRVIPRCASCMPTFAHALPCTRLCLREHSVSSPYLSVTENLASVCLSGLFWAFSLGGRLIVFACGRWKQQGWCGHPPEIWRSRLGSGRPSAMALRPMGPVFGSMGAISE